MKTELEAGAPIFLEENETVLEIINKFESFRKWGLSTINKLSL